jgi:UDP-N-acetyl-2-amino-2-deoxyglucuronate dehydrogenase
MAIGIIGAGNISETHARAALAIPGVTVAAVWGARRERAEQLAARYGGADYRELDAFLNHRPLDFVAIGSPSGLHAAHGIAAAARGLHVMTEKPIDVTVARADALIDAAKSAGVTLGVFFQDRVAPDLVRVKQAIDAGGLGRPVLASARVKWFRSTEYYAGSRWRGTWALDGGGALMNQAIHTVDLMQWLFGPVARVSAATASRLHAIEVEDTAVATVEFQSGALGMIEATTAAFPGYPRRLELTGSAGTITIEGSRIAAVDLRDAADLGLRGGPGDANASESSPVVSDVDGHRRLLEDFIDAVAHRRPPICPGEVGRESVAVVEAIYASAKNGGKVEVGA